MIAVFAFLLSAASATAVDAERAFDAMSAEKGQWTAFRAFAAPDAIMFNPQPVNAQQFLKGRADPPKPVRWQPAETYVSCDGMVAVNTGPWQRPDGSTGYFTTVWQRQSDGGWKWVYDGGDALKMPMAASAIPVLTRANCGRTKPGVLVKPNPPSGDKAGAGAAPDASLRWFWTVTANGARTFSVSLWNGRAWREVLVNRVAAD